MKLSDASIRFLICGSVLFAIFCTCASAIAASRTDGRNLEVFSADKSVALLVPAPEYCAGQGSVDRPVSFFEGWEDGELPAGWTVGSREVANQAAFESGWTVSSNLPPGAVGKIAVSGGRRGIGECDTGDQSGVVSLRSPKIVLDSDAALAAFTHWYETEFARDGGNVKISVNDGPLRSIPAENFVFNPPNLVLSSSASGNPLAGETVFSGSSGGGIPGIWAESRLSLAGLAGLGDSIELVFELGTHDCGLESRWNIDDLGVYSCDGILGAVCGNATLEPGEQCDDGNAMGGDGCSATCQVEPGYQCTDPVPADLTNLVQDPGFEAGAGGGFWDEFSFNFGTPICEEAVCGIPGQRTGAFWVWFGGISGVDEEAHVAQSFTIPTTATEARFWLKVPMCDFAQDYVELLVDDNRLWALFGDDPACGGANYEEITVDISAFADGGMHEVKWHSETFIGNMGFTDFFIDDVAVPHGPLEPIPSECQAIVGFIFGDGFESG